MSTLIMAPRQTGKTLHLVRSALKDIEQGINVIIIVRKHTILRTLTTVGIEVLPNSLEFMKVPTNNILTINNIENISKLDNTKIYIDDYLHVPIRRRQLLQELNCEYTRNNIVAYSDTPDSMPHDLIDACKTIKQQSNKLNHMLKMNIDTFTINEFMQWYFNIISDADITIKNYNTMFFE